MKIIDRYLLRELIPPFFLGIMIFTFVLLMSQILRLMELIVNKGVPTVTVVQLIVFLLPSILVLTVPMSVFLTCIVTFGRWSADNELTAAKSGGIGLLRLSLPVLGFALAVYLLATWMTVYALPHGNQAFRRKMFEIVRSKASAGLQEKVFNDDFEGLVIYVNAIPATNDPVMKGVIITDYRPEKRDPPQEPLTIISEEGWLVVDEESQRVIFRLRNGGIHSLSKDLAKYQKIDFRIHDLQLSLTEEMVDTMTVPKGLREMTLRELWAKAGEYRTQGVRSYGPLVEIHKKFAIPFSTLVLSYLGITMGVLFRRGEKLVSFAVSIAIAVVYYVFLLAGEPLGKAGRIHPFLSMWAANVFFAALTAVLLRMVLKERAPAFLGLFRGGFRATILQARSFLRQIPLHLAVYVGCVLSAFTLFFVMRVFKGLARHPEKPGQAILAAFLTYLTFFLLWAVPAGMMIVGKSRSARWTLVGMTFPVGLILLSRQISGYLGDEPRQDTREDGRRGRREHGREL